MTNTPPHPNAAVLEVVVGPYTLRFYNPKPGEVFDFLAEFERRQAQPVPAADSSNAPTSATVRKRSGPAPHASAPNKLRDLLLAHPAGILGSEATAAHFGGTRQNLWNAVNGLKRRAGAAGIPTEEVVTTQREGGTVRIKAGPRLAEAFTA